MDGRSKAAQHFHSPLSKNFLLLLATSHVWQVVSRNTTQALEARPFCLLARYIFVHIVYNKNNCLMNKELHSLFLLFFPLSLHLHQNKVCLQCQALLVGMQMQSNLNCVFLILQTQDTILFCALVHLISTKPNRLIQEFGNYCPLLLLYWCIQFHIIGSSVSDFKTGTERELRLQRHSRQYFLHQSLASPTDIYLLPIC